MPGELVPQSPACYTEADRKHGHLYELTALCTWSSRTQTTGFEWDTRVCMFPRLTSWLLPVFSLTSPCLDGAGAARPMALVHMRRREEGFNKTTVSEPCRATQSCATLRHGTARHRTVAHRENWIRWMRSSTRDTVAHTFPSLPEIRRRIGASSPRQGRGIPLTPTSASSANSFKNLPSGPRDASFDRGVSPAAPPGIDPLQVSTVWWSAVLSGRSCAGRSRVCVRHGERSHEECGRSLQLFLRQREHRTVPGRGEEAEGEMGPKRYDRFIPSKHRHTHQRRRDTKGTRVQKCLVIVSVQWMWGKSQQRHHHPPLPPPPAGVIKWSGWRHQWWPRGFPISRIVTQWWWLRGHCWGVNTVLLCVAESGLQCANAV